MDDESSLKIVNLRQQKVRASTRDWNDYGLRLTDFGHALEAPALETHDMDFGGQVKRLSLIEFGPEAPPPS